MASHPPPQPDASPRPESLSPEPSASPRAIGLLSMMLLPGLGPVRVRRVLEAFGGSADAALGASQQAWLAVPGIGLGTADRALRAAREVGERARQECELAMSAGVSLLAIGDDNYPPLLAQLEDAPPVLYVRGRLEPAGEDAYPVAIVGSRRCTQYGIEQAERFGGVLGRSGLTIVSGGARGIDTAAHRGSLRSGGRTVVVQGCGLGRCYPPENHELYERIVAEKRGAIVSELPMLTEPKGEQFPARNRIISGLSLGVIVVEAATKSGALITARVAVEEQGREVMVVPGRVDSPASAGSLELLKKGGAALVTEPGDVLDLLEAPARFAHEGAHEARYTDPSRVPGASGGTDADAVLAVLAEGPATMDEVLVRTELGVDRVRVAMTMLELTGRVGRRGGRFAVAGG